MTIYPIGTKNDDETRNIINNNFGFLRENSNELTKEINDVKKYIDNKGEEILSEAVVKEWLAKNEFKPKDAVATFNDLPQDAELKELRGVTDENAVYVFDGTKWVEQSNLNFDGLSNYKKDLTTRSINVMFPPPPLAAAKGDGITDDTEAIQAIIDSLKPYQKIFIPEGEFKLSKTLIIKKDNVEYEQRGMLLDYGIHFEGFKIKATGVKTKRKKAVWDDGAVGITIKNVNNSIIGLDEVYGYDQGILIIGENKGTAYNNIHLNYLINNRCDITFRGLGDGWICENTFHAGRFAVTGEYKETNKLNPGWCIIFDTDSAVGMSYNGNKFLHPSFESKHNGIKFNKASYIYIDNPRFEGVDDNWLVQDAASNGITLITGYTELLPQEKVKLNGSYNIIIGRLGGANAMTISGERGIGFNTKSAFPAIRTSNGNFDIYDANGGKTIIGNNTLKTPNGTGISDNKLTLFNDKNYVSSIYFASAAPESNVGLKGDIVFNNQMVETGFAGWQKTSTGWKKFGALQ